MASGPPAQGLTDISPFTVNDTTEQLKKLFTRAKAWGVRFDHEPVWSYASLGRRAARARARAARDHEGDRSDAAMRGDQRVLRVRQGRLRECLLRWSEVDWSTCESQARPRGGKSWLRCRSRPALIREVLWPLRDHHPEHVFTYQAQRGLEGGTVFLARDPRQGVAEPPSARRLRRGVLQTRRFVMDVVRNLGNTGNISEIGAGLDGDARRCLHARNPTGLPRCIGVRRCPYVLQSRGESGGETTRPCLSVALDLEPPSVLGISHTLLSGGGPFATEGGEASRGAPVPLKRHILHDHQLQKNPRFRQHHGAKFLG